MPLSKPETPGEISKKLSTKEIFSGQTETPLAFRTLAWKGWKEVADNLSNGGSQRSGITLQTWGEAQMFDGKCRGTLGSPRQNVASWSFWKSLRSGLNSCHCGDRPQWILIVDFVFVQQILIEGISQQDLCLGLCCHIQGCDLLPGIMWPEGYSCTSPTHEQVFPFKLR